MEVKIHFHRPQDAGAVLADTLDTVAAQLSQMFSELLDAANPGVVERSL